MAKTTQRDKVIAYIREFGYITSWDAYADLGIMQLGARIFELKEQGYLFKKEKVKKLNRWGQEVKFDKYMLVGNIHDITDKAKENVV